MLKCVYSEEGKPCGGNLDCSAKCFTNPLRKYMDDNKYDEELITELEAMKDELVKELYM